MLERKKKLLEKMKLKREKKAGLSGSARIAPTKPTLAAPGSKPMSSAPPKSSASRNPSSDSKKMSYKEMLARAAKLQVDQKKLGVITHKPRAPVLEKKEWQKKLEAKQLSRVGALPSEQKNSLGVLSNGDKVGLASKKGKEVVKPTQIKKVGGDIDSRRPSASKGKLAERSRPTEPPIKRKRSPSPISWRGKKSSASAPSKKPNDRRGRGRYDEDEDEDDDWIVDDDDEGVETNYRQRYG
jgi:protein SPT2